MALGYKNADVAQMLNDDLLASTQAIEKREVIIDTSARDTGHPDGSTNLRTGLLLGKVTASGRYKEYDSGAVDGTEAEEDAVVLAHEVRSIDDGHNPATVYYAATFNKDAIHVTGAAPTWGDVQRLQRV